MKTAISCHGDCVSIYGLFFDPLFKDVLFVQETVAGGFSQMFWEDIRQSDQISDGADEFDDARTGSGGWHTHAFASERKRKSHHTTDVLGYVSSLY